MRSVLSLPDVGPRRMWAGAHDLSCATWRCPSCNGNHIAYNTLGCRCECDDCGAIGPAASDGDSITAINAWNAWVLDKIGA